MSHPPPSTGMPTVCKAWWQEMLKNWKEEFEMGSTLPEEFDSQILCKWVTAIQSHPSLIGGLETGAKFTPGEPGAVCKHSPGLHVNSPLLLIWTPSHLQTCLH